MSLTYRPLLSDFVNIEQNGSFHVRAAVSSENGRLVVHVGDAFECEAPTEEGFAGIIVDMFSDGAVVPALQQPQTWQHLRRKLKPGGKQASKQQSSLNAHEDHISHA